MTELEQAKEKLRALGYIACIETVLSALERAEAEVERLRAPQPETAWLIEESASGPVWWTGKRPGTEDQWSRDSLEAVRFSRRGDADRARLTLPDGHLAKVTEHMWLAATKEEPHG